MKTWLRICTFVASVSLLWLLLFAFWHSIFGAQIATYDRFEILQNDTRSFNWWGLLSPIQVEATKYGSDTIRFERTVRYPLAPRFQMIAPGSDSVERSVAFSIAHAVSDSVERPLERYMLDYDGSSESVRRARRPAVFDSVSHPFVTMNLIGTASPEAKKYGLRESLAPNHIEPENLTLAERRLERTASILKKELRGMEVSIPSLKAIEVQIDSAEIERVLRDPHRLDPLRYVKASVTIALYRKHVTTTTAPFLLPLWFALGALAGKLLSILVRPATWRRRRYWYFAFDHPRVGKPSASVISSLDRRFPAYAAHEKIKLLLLIPKAHHSLSVEIHHHFRISADQYFALLEEEAHRKSIAP